MKRKFKQGDKVRQIVAAPVTGTVDRFTFDQNTGDIGCVVQSVDADGNVHERAFTIDQLEADE